jgi:hypothetical protein
MMKTKKTIAIIALIALVGFSMAGCPNETDTPPAHEHLWGGWNVTLEANWESPDF